MSRHITEPFENNDSPRWLQDITNEEHHKMKMVSATQIKHFAKYGAKSFYEKYILGNKKEYETNESMLRGTLVHMALLEPEKFEINVKTTDHSKTTKLYKAELHRLFGDTPTKEQHLIDKELYDEVVKMRDSVLSHPIAHKLFKGSFVTEVSGVAYSKKHNLHMCIRPDLMKRNMIVDVKTIRSLDKKTIGYQIIDLGYYLQAAHYLYVANKIEPDVFDTFIFVFVESQAPYASCVVSLSPEYMEFAITKYKKILGELAGCVMIDHYPNIDNDEILVIEKPRWIE